MTEKSEKSSINTSSDTKKDENNNIYSRYFVKRGFQGWLGYTFGMVLSRIFIKLKAVGTENIPLNTPYVMAPNHVTYVDGMWVSSYIPRKHFKVMCCMAAKELEDSHGWLGRLIMKVGRGIAADRFGNPIRALILAKKQLDEGEILLIHPEGTRSSDGKLSELKDGASYLSLKAKCPLLPIYIHGGYEVFNRHMKLPNPFKKKPFGRKTVTLYYGKPLMPSNYKNACEMTAALTEWMKKLEDELS